VIPSLNRIFDEPWDPDARLRERLIARGPALAVLAVMIVIAVRLSWLWTSGVIKTEPFFGSAPWNFAIAAPAVVIFGSWWAIISSREKNRERKLSTLMPTEPLSRWHGLIRSFDATLERGTPTHDVDVKVLRLTLEIVDAYPGLDATQREHVRMLWRTYQNFGTYASVTDRLEDEGKSLDSPLTAEEVRRELILESIRDQFPDARDAAVSLADLRTGALAAGIDFSSLAQEVAELSDDTRRDTMFGSTRDVILRQAAP
jgi:hypothetical protein